MSKDSKNKLRLLLLVIVVMIGLNIWLLVSSRKKEPTKKSPKHESIVRLVDNDETFCSGTEISPHTILTAAHCVAQQNPFTGETEVKSPIEIRPPNNKPTDTFAKVYAVRCQQDQALLTGDFSAYSVRGYISDVTALTLLRTTATLTTCGYPLGDKFYCNTFFYREPDNFFWKGVGVLIPGMSGGPVIDQDGNVVATNVAVAGPYSIVSPIYNLYIQVIP